MTPTVLGLISAEGQRKILGNQSWNRLRDRCQARKEWKGVTDNQRDRELYQLAERVVRGTMSRAELLKRATALGIGGSALASLLAACGGDDEAARTTPAGTEPSEEISGTISTIANTGAGAESEAWNKRIEEFEKLFPQVSVKRQESVGQTFYDIVPQVETQIAGGSAPDTVRVGNFTVAQFASRDALLPLDDLIANDPDLDWDDFNETARRAMTFDGQVYALPENAESYGINYNRTAFEEKGLPDPRELWDKGEWTADAFLEASQALTEGSGANKKFGFVYETWNSENWIFFNGGRVLSDDGTQVLIDQPAAYEGLQFAADLVNVHKVSPNPAELAGRPPVELFQQGIARMYMLGGWFIANFATGIKDFEYMTAGPPVLKEKTSKMEISGYGITKQSKNPEAAWEFIKFITGPEGQRIWSIVGQPTRKSSTEEFLRTSEFSQYFQPFLELMPDVRWTPFIAKGAEINQILSEEQDGIFLGRVSAESAAADMAKRMREVLSS